ncbi:endonuclease G, mitochondrial-like isoform X2 [Clavelina lepadiformis]|uniref:endonuclease G, mitochondrial-like isoform X2 n=1 Tax=Clavelina lepadiformis TaxID=159417 RepID=UPI004041C8A9
MFKRICGTIATLAIGGLAGSELQKRWANSRIFFKNAEAAMPLLPTRPTEIMKYGFPSNTNLKMRENYVLSYDTRCRNAHWVFEHLTRDLVKVDENSANREEHNFQEDGSIPKPFRATNQDFFRSGFDRGHLAAAANHRANKHWMADTFYLSNISPQHPQLNRNAWNNLEKYTRSLAYHYDNVYVCTGPLYLPRRENDGKLYVTYQVLEPNHVAVPTHFFKVILCERQGHFDLKSYMMPNEPVDPKIPLKSFMVPVEVIERASGMFLFERVRGLP